MKLGTEESPWTRHITRVVRRAVRDGEDELGASRSVVKSKLKEIEAQLAQLEEEDDQTES